MELKKNCKATVEKSPRFTRPAEGRLCADVLKFSRRIAGSCQITTTCICNGSVSKFSDAKAVLEILVVVQDFQPRLMSNVKAFDERNVIFYVVDKWIFERDVDKGFLGEALAGKMIFPYKPLINGNYLYLQEVKLKKRLVLELLENLIYDYPELCYEFHIKPEYFMYETILSRARLFPPMTHNLLSFMQSDAIEENVDLVMHGYLQALKELEEENAIASINGHIKISKKLVEEVRKRKARFINVLKTAQRTLFTSLLGIFTTAMNIFSQNKKSFFKLRRNTGDNSRITSQLENPYQFLCVPTSRGLVPMASEIDLKAFAKEVLSTRNFEKVKVEEIGGVLNDVFLIRDGAEDKGTKVVVKRFRGWSSFKWFPLTLWALGTRKFAVSARSRLERECAINQFLRSKGFAVPTILHVSHGKRLIFMKYVEGKNLSELMKEIVNVKDDRTVTENLHVIGKVGERFAEIHALDIALGDAKPENTIVDKKGNVYLLDLEQASRNGDKTWDIAEFLYYAGHYISPFVGTRSVELITRAFVQGYLNGGGDAKFVRRAANPKYTKVFSIFTFPHVVLVISNICRKTGV